MKVLKLSSVSILAREDSELPPVQLFSKQTVVCVYVLVLGKGMGGSHLVNTVKGNKEFKEEEEINKKDM